MRPVLIILFLLSLIEAIPVTYGFSSRILKFSEAAKSQWVSVPHYKNHMILYCLTSISIRGYFSYSSSHSLNSL